MLCVFLPRRTDSERKRQRQRECTCLAQLSSASNTALIPRLLLLRVLTEKTHKARVEQNWRTRVKRLFFNVFFFFNRDKPSCPWMREKRIERLTVARSNLVTSHLATFLSQLLFFGDKNATATAC